MDSHVVERRDEGLPARWRHAMQTCRSILNRSLVSRSRYDTGSSKKVENKDSFRTCHGSSVGYRGGKHASRFRNRIAGVKIDVLLRDLAAVVTGLRTGVLLSHLHLGSEEVTFECAMCHCIRVMCDAISQKRSLIGQEQEQVVVGTTGRGEKEGKKLQHTDILLLTSLLDEGSLLVVSLTALKHTPYPKGIVFCKNIENPEGLMEPAWARSSEQEALEQCFRSIHDALMLEQAATTFLQEIEHTVDNQACAMVLESCLSRHNITLGEGGYPSIPTLYGWMLGYPVTYVVVGAEHASSVSRSLSATTCVFYSVRTRMHSICTGDDDARDHEQETEEVMAFSVPQRLLLQQQEDACDEHLSAWQQRLSCQKHEWCWAPPLCDTFSTMTGILI